MTLSRRDNHGSHDIDGCQAIFKNLMFGTFRLKTFEQAQALTSAISRTCEETDRVALGLFELLANAIEHGNLGISHKEKLALIEKGRYSEEIRRRLALPAYRERYVEINFERHENRLIFRIEDQGTGFSHDDYLTGELSNNEKYHGRGIALAREYSFDHLEYSGTGNRVTAIIDCASLSRIPAYRDHSVKAGEHSE